MPKEEPIIDVGGSPPIGHLSSLKRKADSPLVNLVSGVKRKAESPPIAPPAKLPTVLKQESSSVGAEDSNPMKLKIKVCLPYVQYHGCVVIVIEGKTQIQNTKRSAHCALVVSKSNSASSRIVELEQTF